MISHCTGQVRSGQVSSVQFECRLYGMNWVQLTPRKTASPWPSYYFLFLLLLPPTFLSFFLFFSLFLEHNGVSAATEKEIKDQDKPVQYLKWSYNGRTAHQQKREQETVCIMKQTESRRKHPLSGGTDHFDAQAATQVNSSVL